MNVTYRNQQYTVDPCTLILRESGFYARIEVAGARVPMTVYVKVDPPVVEVAEPPTYYTVPENIYPQALWLGIANGILEQSKRKLDIRVAVATSELPVAA